MTTNPRSDSAAATLGRPAREDFLKVAEIATRLRVSKMTVYRLIHDGELVGAYRVGRQMRVPAAAVEAYLKDSVISHG
ncbi:helix-turn-helix domain-containing protein [Nonomuraea mangrovi]|uniref:Helix-turn-helix domain-containing protein n=1 Tax=Nonomuraea mangrovi TaxID=2316207 RepID=A0ABW4TFM2_9ACTN